MKTLLLFLAALTLAGTNYAQGNYEWAIAISGKSDEYSKAIATDKSGNVVITGYFADTVDFDPGADTFYLSKKAGFDAFVAKYDSSGKLIWAKPIGGIGTEEGRSVKTDDSGSIYLSGYFDGSCDFDPDTAVRIVNSKGNEDAFILKLDKDGQYQWVITYGSGAGEIAQSLAIDRSGYIVATGYFSGKLDFDPGTDTSFLDSRYGSVFIVKLTPEGKLVWAKNYGDSGTLVISSVCTDPENNIISGGSFQLYADFDPDTSRFLLGPSIGGTDNYILKLDSLGTFVWAKQIEGSSYEYGTRVQASQSGDIYCSGHYQSTCDFDPGPATYNLKANATDIFVSKLDSSGAFKWAKSMGGYADDVCYAMAIDDTGNVYTTGLYGASGDFDPGLDTFEMKSYGGNEIYVSKLDSLGNFVWARSMDSSSMSAGTGIAIDFEGNIYTTGYFSGNVDFDFSPYAHPLRSKNTDIFILKLNADTIATKKPVPVWATTEKTAVIRIYPNPNPGIFKVQTPVGKNCTIEVYNLLGTLVYCETPDKPISTIDIGSQPDGYFIVRIYSGDGLLASTRLIKQSE